jgi:hypothetical protein
MRRERRRSADRVLDEDDPLAGMVNLFDIAIVFAVGLMVALAAATRSGRLSPNEGAQAPVEADVREGQTLVRYRATHERSKGPGRLIGTAYRLPSGEVVYVPGGAPEGAPEGAAEATSSPKVPEARPPLPP